MLTGRVVEHVRRQVGNHHLPGWARVWAWGVANADEHGHARLYPGQLRKDLGLGTTREASRAIRLARDRGVIDQASTASCIVMPGAGAACCDAVHRDGA